MWNLEFAIFDFITYKILFHRARFPYGSLMRMKKNKIYLLWFTSFTFLCSFMKNQHYDLFSYSRHWPHHSTLTENNFSLSQFLQIKAWKYLLHVICLYITLTLQSLMVAKDHTCLDKRAAKWKYVWLLFPPGLKGYDSPVGLHVICKSQTICKIICIKSNLQRSKTSNI